MELHHQGGGEVEPLHHMTMLDRGGVWVEPLHHVMCEDREEGAGPPHHQDGEGGVELGGEEEEEGEQVLITYLLVPAWTRGPVTMAELQIVRALFLEKNNQQSY